MAADVTPAGDAQALSNQLKQLAQSPAVVAEADSVMAACRAIDLVSDWDACAEKMKDFTQVCVAAAKLLPPGGTVETGVFRGGTAAILLHCASRNSFHVSIDPYGLPSQSYDDLRETYGEWPEVRRTMSRLTGLAESREITFCHYLMGASDFIRADHLQHPAHFRIVHLDGDHSRAAVAEELAYFRRRIRGPALFVLDDHDDHFPGVEEGLRDEGGGLVPVFHRMYDFPGTYGLAGFSAWLHV
jgi:hypothetical protein